MTSGKRSSGQRNTTSAKRRRMKRATIRKRDGDDCWICGEVMIFHEDRPFREGSNAAQHDMAATIDHVIERARGGSNANDNLRLAHRKCNNLRTNGKKSPTGTLSPAGASASERRGGVGPFRISVTPQSPKP